MRILAPTRMIAVAALPVLVVAVAGRAAAIDRHQAETRPAQLPPQPPPDPSHCVGVGQTGGPTCIGALPKGWTGLTQDSLKTLFGRMRTAFRKASSAAAGPKGGIAMRQQGKHWLKVEPLPDAHLWHMKETNGPTVVAVITLVRSEGTDASTNLDERDTGFLVVYPDEYDADDVKDTADSRSFFQIVRHVDRKLATDRIDIPRVDTADIVVDCGHAKRNDFSYADFESCAGAQISRDERMHQMSMTFAEARATLNKLKGPDSTLPFAVALRELLEGADKRRAKMSTAAPDDSAHLLAYVEHGVWFSCALGCCYAKTARN